MMSDFLTYINERGLPLVKPSQSMPRIGGGYVFNMVMEISATS